ncbi:MAG: TetR family transcriptional regulator [Frankiaceae bacterium]
MTPTPGKRSKAADKVQPPAKRASGARGAPGAGAGATARHRGTARKASAAAAAAPAVPPVVPVGKRTGRRPGVSGSRQAIIDAARAKFAERGYEGATIRSIAHEAGVDAALIHHFFDTKEGVFAAAMQNAFHPADLLPEVLEPGIDGLGERLVRMFLDLWDVAPTRDTLQAIIRSAVSHPDAARLLREFVSTELLGRVAHEIDRSEPDLRAALVGSQLVGFALMRYIVGVEPLASLGKEQAVQIIAPTIQHYLADDLPEVTKPSRRRTRRVS